MYVWYAPAWSIWKQYLSKWPWTEFDWNNSFKKVSIDCILNWFKGGLHFSLFSFWFSSFTEKGILANKDDFSFGLFWIEEDCVMNCNWSDLLLFLYWFQFHLFNHIGTLFQKPNCVVWNFHSMQKEPIRICMQRKKEIYLDFCVNIFFKLAVIFCALHLVWVSVIDSDSQQQHWIIIVLVLHGIFSTVAKDIILAFSDMNQLRWLL